MSSPFCRNLTLSYARSHLSGINYNYVPIQFQAIQNTKASEGWMSVKNDSEIL